MVPGGGLDLLFGSLRVPYGPIVPPGRFMEDFGDHFGSHLESNIFDVWCRCWMSFRDAFLSGFRMFLDMFWEALWCQNDMQKAKGGFVKMLVLHK